MKIKFNLKLKKPTRTRRRKIVTKKRYVRGGKKNGTTRSV